MASVPFSVRLDAVTRARLEAEAERVERPAGQVAERAIERCLDAPDAFRRTVDEALDEADKGVSISAEAVHSWMASRGTEDGLPPPEPNVLLDKRRMRILPAPQLLDWRVAHAGRKSIATPLMQ